MNLCSCSCRRAGRRSASIHSDSVFGSSTPCTGENRTAAARAGQVVARDDVARELVVGAILDHELHLVVRRQPVEVAPVVLAGFAAARALDVDDLHAPPPARASIGRWPPVSSMHRRAAGQQPLHQRIDVVLQQRLAAGDLDERAAVALDRRDHLVDRHLAPFVERVGRVAPRAAQVAGRQPHEHARAPGAGRLALNRMEDLVDGQHRHRTDRSIIARCADA